MIPLQWRSLFAVNDEVIFECQIPTRPWLPQRAGVGGSLTAAGGVPAGYKVRTDYLFEVPIRFEESERQALYDLIEWTEIGEVVTWFPDADELDSYDVYIETPKAGDTLAPTRNEQYPRMFETTLVLRFVGNRPVNLEYFEDD